MCHIVELLRRKKIIRYGLNIKLYYAINRKRVLQKSKEINI